jgi:hypothetical protein
MTLTHNVVRSGNIGTDLMIRIVRADDQSGQRERRNSGVHAGQAGEPTTPPPLIWATIRGPSMPALS